MLPSDVVADINSKKSQYREIAKYMDFYSSLLYLFGSDVVSSLSIFFEDLIIYLLRQGKVPRPALSSPAFYAIQRAWELWESLDLRGTYIYRGTSASFLSETLKSGGGMYCVSCDSSDITNWSFYPLPALYYASMRQNPVVLVAKYDPKYCTKVYYYILRGEVNGVVNDKFVAYGGIAFMWEAEVRCYKFPLSNVKYKLFGSDLLELLDISADVAPWLVNKEDLEGVLK